jgi:hypothetical protein
MRKLIVIALVGALAGTALPAALARGGKQQAVEGMIALPAPYTDDSGCFAGVHRRVQAVAQGAANGVFGYNFAVDKATWNKNFVLDVTGGQGDVDFDITFYLGPLTTLQDFIDQGGDPAPPATVSFATRAPGGEAGKVPPAAENVIICMYAGAQGYTGAGASFAYTAGKGVKPPKS